MTQRITTALEIIGAVKNLTMLELLALMQALNGKTKSSQDFAGKDERDYFSFGMFDDQITDTRYYLSLRNEAAYRDVEDAERDPRLAYFGDQTYSEMEFR